MRHGVVLECSEEIAAPCEAVFDVIHDYEIRLQWDSLLSEARIVTGGCAKAALGVTTLCVGRPVFGKVGVETTYVSFTRPRVAAVKLNRGPWFLAEFAASIRHTPVDEHRSRVVYKLRITPRPAWLRFLLDPLLTVVFGYETRKRLAALKRYMELFNHPPA